MRKNMIKLFGFALGLGLALTSAYAENGSNAYLDLNGTPALMSTGTNGLTVGAGGAGTLKLHLGSGTMQLPISNPANGTAATTVATSGTIDTTQMWQRVTDAGAITGVIMEAGTVHGQLALVSVDKDASGTVTMAAEATSNVCAGVTVVMAAGESALFVWDATDTCWAGFQT